LGFDPKRWAKISIRIHPAAHESMSAFLFDLGCTGIVLEDKQNDQLSAYLPLIGDLDTIRGRLGIFLEQVRAIFPQIPTPDLEFATLPDENWALSWQRFFHSEAVTALLTVYPPWERPPTARGHKICMDPGPAFGTGKHATTRMCLEAIEEIGLPASFSMLDVGTGSGILAIYGAKLGADSVLAMDKDPEALRWAGHNIELNRLSGLISLSGGELRDLRRSFHLVTANVLLGPILDMLPDLSRLLRPQGYLILSGLLSEQVQRVDAALGAGLLRKETERHRDEWAALVCRRQEPVQSELGFETFSDRQD